MVTLLEIGSLLHATGRAGDLSEKALSTTVSFVSAVLQDMPPSKLVYMLLLAICAIEIPLLCHVSEAMIQVLAGREAKVEEL